MNCNGIDFRKDGQTVIIKRIPKDSAYYGSRHEIEGKKFLTVYPHKMAPILVCVVPHPDEFYGQEKFTEIRKKRKVEIDGEIIKRSARTPLYLLKDTEFELVVEEDSYEIEEKEEGVYDVKVDRKQKEGEWRFHKFR